MTRGSKPHTTHIMSLLAKRTVFDPQNLGLCSITGTAPIDDPIDDFRDCPPSTDPIDRFLSPYREDDGFYRVIACYDVNLEWGSDD